ncbi:MAG TPA: hypothetical protein VFE15_10105 [Marmoricola sp.]|jgi:hypothetical protein|nr:hypothetical protein [Marmoricola sp.]
MMRRTLPWLVAALLAVMVSGCGGASSAPTAAATDVHVGLPAGDGTEASYVGYSLTGVALPTKAGVPQRYAFHIDDYQHKPLTQYVVDLTKKMHLYFVSSDFAVYRHVHPTMAADGTWSGEVTLPLAGDYRMVAEFITTDAGGTNNQIVLGAQGTVGHPGAVEPVPAASRTSTAYGLTLSVVKAPTTGYQHEMEIGISKGGKPADLGSYLGVYAHVSAFNTATGGLEHIHALSAPENRGNRAVLLLHTNVEQPGDYRMFVQVRVSGIVWTIPITIAVTGPSAPAL